jgi:uncharacterized protein
VSVRSSAVPVEGRVVHRERPLRLRVHAWLRWLHIYISMFTLLVVLFFAVTGITLNHPTWVLGGSESAVDVSGTLPAGWKQGEEVDWLRVVEFLRAEHGVRGRLGDYRVDETEGSLTFKGPGYSADCFFDPATGSYDMTIVQQGALGVLNDLHRGRDSGAAWAWLVDLSGAFLTLVALTGIGLLWYLKKLRAKALATMAVGAVLVLVLMKMAT